MKILVVEDEAPVAQVLETLLVGHHYAVDVAIDGLEGLAMTELYSYDLLVLDLGLPNIDGLSLCQQLRAKGIQTPILLLTGLEVEAHGKAIALNAGADDYVTKPFDTEELLARVRTLLRRGDLKALPVLRWGALSLDPSRLRVSYGDQLLPVTPKEYSLLEMLLRYAPHVLSARSILEQGWNALAVPGDETIRTHIKDLRKKLRVVGAPDDLIKTVRRQGYQMNALYGEAIAKEQREAANTLQVAELRDINGELRKTLDQLQAAQAELQRKNQELQTVRDELEHMVMERTTALNQREAFLQNIYEESEQAIFVVAVTETGDFRYVSLNRAAQQVMGLSRQEFQDRTPEAVFGEELGGVLRRNYARCVQQNRSLIYEDHFVFQDRPFWIMTKLSPLRDATGKIYQLVGASWDISDRKRSEMQMTKDLEVMELLRSLSTSPIINGDPQALYDDILAVAVTIMGADAGTLQLLDPDTQELVLLSAIGLAPSITEQFVRVGIQPDTACGQALATGQRMLIDFCVDEEVHSAEICRLHREVGYRSAQSTPLMNRRQQPIGMVSTHWHRTHQPGDRELRFLDLLVRQAADLIEQSQTYAALRQNEELLQLALRGANAGSWHWHVGTGKVSWSAETCRLYGLDPALDSMDFKHWYSNILHPDDRHNVQTAVEQVFTEKLPILELEFRIRHAQRGICWFLSLGHVTYNEQSEPLRVSGINLDITDRKQAELDLRQQIRQEYLLADIAQEIRQSLELDQVLHSAVHRIREWLKCDRVVIFQFHPDWQGDVIMESVGDNYTAIQSTTLVDPCFEEHFIEPYHHGHISILNDINQANLKPCYVEFLRQFQVQASLAVPILQGEGLWGLLIAHHCAAPRQWQNMEIVTLRRLSTQVGIAIHQAELYEQIRHELTHRARMQTVLQESEARLQAIIDYAPAVIYVLDPENRHLLVNRSYANLFDQPVDRLIGKTVEEVWSPAIADAFIEQNQTVLTSGQLLQTEDRLLLADGHRTYITVKFPLCDPTGTAYAVCGISTDITEQKNLEAQFYQAQRLESLGTLASGIAHDLNNMLTPILGMTQILQLYQKGLDAKGLEQLRFIESSARRGANLVKQILSVTRMSQGTKVPVDLAALLWEEIEMIQRSFPNTINIHVNLPPADQSQPALGLILTDPVFLHQIILNLCINARDAMPDGGSISIAAAKVFVDEAIAAKNLDAHVGDYALISIIDTGQGMSPKVLKRMFDPFFTTKPPGLGTGLGLTTVHGLVKANQGFLQVFSQEGQGTQFHIYLPLMTDNTLAQQTLQEPSSPVTPAHPEQLVLVVEDEALLRTTLQLFLETNHYRTLLADNGATALELYQEHGSAIQLIVTDLMMPVMDGFTLIKHLKTMHCSVPIIALCGVSTHEALALEAGADCFMAKPFDLHILLQQIATLSTQHSVIATP